MDLRVVLLLLLCAVGKWHAAAAEPCSEEASMRLVDGPPSSNCGRVEVCHDGVWGTVCDDSFDGRDADVVCKTVGGFAEHISRHFRAYFGEGTGPIWLDNLRCARSFTNITQCTPLNWGRHDCEHDEDAGVCCKRAPAPKPPHLPVRLVSSCGHLVPYPKCPDKFHPHGVPSISGILEVQVNGVWGRIGAVDWNSAAATVLCGEMGYPLATALTDETIGLESGSGTGFIAPLATSNNMTYLHELECTGKERELLSCFFSALGPQANPIGRVAAVNCSCKPYLPPENSMLRLKGGVWPWQGRVEVFKDGEWGTVCDVRFDVHDGNIVCRELGYGSVETIFPRARLGQALGAIHLSNCQCTGTEEHLIDCPCTTGREVERQCKHTGDIGVLCHVPNTTFTDEMVVSEYRYPNERAPWLFHSYVEVSLPSPTETTSRALRNGLVCASVVTKACGEVFCRYTKGMFLSVLSKGDNMPRGYNGFAYAGQISCSGGEDSFSDCDVSLHSVRSCPDGYSVIDCTPGAADLVPDVDRLRDSMVARRYIDRLPIYYLLCALEEGCLSTSANGAPQTNERHLLRFDSMAWNLGTADFRPIAPMSEWEWHSCHRHYHSVEEFVHYDLFSATTGEKVAEGHKASFCLEDSFCGRYYSSRFHCAYHQQGISVGCADIYGSYLDCQWVDMTGNRAGEYILQVHLNPNRLMVESDYSNNIAKCSITITAYYSALVMTVNGCWLSEISGGISTG